MNLVPWEVLVDAWQTGYEHALRQVWEAADDVVQTKVKPAAAQPYERRLAQRLALFEHCAAAGHERHGTREWRGLERGDRLAPW